MKLENIIKNNKLIKTSVVKKHTSPDEKFFKTRERKLKWKSIGHGLSAMVVPSSNAHTVYKFVKDRDGNPGLDKFMRYVLKHQEENPFLPRIYKIYERTDETGFKYYDYEMEKLIPWKQIEPDFLYDYIDRIVDMKAFAKRFHKKYDKETVLTKKYKMDDFIADAGILIQNYPEYIKDEKLKKIVKDIRINDMTYDNMMFRRTGHGIQLVMVDPMR